MRRTFSLLPAQPTPLVGRTDELATINERLGSGDTRLLTLTGPAGVGKTRLALEAAAKLADVSGLFPEGIAFVDLTALRGPELVPSSLASAVGVLDVGKKSLISRLEGVLREKDLLLVIDNFEHVLPAAPALAALLSACPRLKMLVTSRVPLQLRWERTLGVAPLPIPDLSAPLVPMDEFSAIPSVALFLQQARAHRHDFVLTSPQAPLLARLTAQLDGLPLALELAAARTATLSLPAIVDRLGDQFQFLRWAAQDAPERQQSLQAAIGWSYDLLSEPERRLFRCLGVFAGRVSLDAMLSVLGEPGGAEADGGRVLEGLISLATQSLLIPERSNEHAWQAEWSDAYSTDDDNAIPAFGMLETVRLYAEEQLSAAEEMEAARQSHAAYFLALAERADPELRGRDQQRWFLRLEHEHANLRMALRWLLTREDRMGREQALRLAGALGYFWQLRGYHAEGRKWLEAALAVASPRAEVDAAVILRALLRAGWLLAFCGELQLARVRLEEALELAQRRQDAASIVRCLIYLGVCPVFAGGSPDLMRLRDGLGRARTLDQADLLGVALFYLAMAEHAENNVASAARHCAEALDALNPAGDIHVMAGIRIELGAIFGRQGDIIGAARLIGAGITASVVLRDRWLLSQSTWAALSILGDHAGLPEEARLQGAVDALRQATGSGRLVWERELTEEGRPAVQMRREEGKWAVDYREGRSLPAGEVAALTSRLLSELAGEPFDEIALTSVGMSGRAQSVLKTPEDFKSYGEHVLTEREGEVLRLVAEGLSSKAIGRQLFISSRTVSQHLTSIFNKLGTNTRAQAVAVATRRGFI